MNMAKVVISDQGREFLEKGQMWMYRNNLLASDENIEDGSIVRILSEAGEFVASGFYSACSHIIARILSRNEQQVIDRSFFENRLKAAWEFRKTTNPDNLSNCRLVFSEADFLPGIVIDKFADVLVVESLALGIDRLKSVILEELSSILASDGYPVRGIYERSDAKVRLQEGMERFKGYLSDPFDPRVEIVENGVHYIVNVEDGQKTGFFLDQKYNRRALGKLCAGKEVLDCFTHTGSFALNAGLAGASSVLGVDASMTAVKQAIEIKRRHPETEVFCFYMGSF